MSFLACPVQVDATHNEPHTESQKTHSGGVDEGRLWCRVDQATSRGTTVNRPSSSGLASAIEIGSNVMHILPKGYQYEENATCVRLGVNQV